MCCAQCGPSRVPLVGTISADVFPPSSAPLRTGRPDDSPSWPAARACTGGAPPTGYFVACPMSVAESPATQHYANAWHSFWPTETSRCAQDRLGTLSRRRGGGEPPEPTSPARGAEPFGLVSRSVRAGGVGRCLGWSGVSCLHVATGSRSAKMIWVGTRVVALAPARACGSVLGRATVFVCYQPDADRAAAKPLQMADTPSHRRQSH